MKKALLGLMIFACVFFSVSCSTNKSTPTYSVTVLSTSSTTTLKTTVEETTTTEETTENGEIMWNDAIDHVGEYATVVGEGKSIKYSSYSNGSPLVYLCLMRFIMAIPLLSQVILKHITV